MKGFLPWLGGKRLLSKEIVKRIDRVEHRCYVELFAGAAHVFFRREPVRAEVLNDINHELVTLYRVLQWHLEEFLRFFKWALVSRDEWDRLQRVSPETLTDVQRAARFYYLQKLAFGGKVTGQNFAMHRRDPPRVNLLRIEEELSAVHLRLARVTVENLPWQRCLENYDSADAFIYIDPPYLGCEEDYGKGIFAQKDFCELSDRLRGIEGKFLLSLNDRPEIRKLFAWAKIEAVPTRYTVSAGDSKPVRELLISTMPLRSPRGMVRPSEKGLRRKAIAQTK